MVGKNMQAVIISIGDELTLGQVVDTNAVYINASLSEHGVFVRYQKTVPDIQALITQAIKEAVNAADLVVLTGGLGPTPDDLTRQALADVLGAKLVMSKPALKQIQRFFKERGRTMSECNRNQALCPAGAELLDNPLGTAPGLKAVIARTSVFSLPGVPSEMKAMLARHVLPFVSAGSNLAVRFAQLNTYGMGESALCERLGELLSRDRNPRVGTTASSGIVSLRVMSGFNSSARSEKELKRTLQAIRQKLKDVIFSEGETDLPAAVGQLLLSQRRTLVTAESCTGGLVGKMLTDQPGASAYYLGGWIVYSNQLKQDQLAVPRKLLEREGSVSEKVARCLAEQALLKSAADYALALTGIAGPTGGSKAKPVGTVWIALAQRKNKTFKVKAEIHHMFGDRQIVRERSAYAALNLLRLTLIQDQST